MKWILKILTAPVILLIDLFTLVCVGIISCSAIPLRIVSGIIALLAPADNADITMIDGYGYHLPDKRKTRKNGTDAKGGYTVFVGVQG